jgi:uncharacterized protein YpmB
MKKKQKKFILVFTVILLIIGLFIFKLFDKNEYIKNPQIIEAENRVNEYNQDKNFDLPEPYLGPNQGTGINQDQEIPINREIIQD